MLLVWRNALAVALLAATALLSACNKQNAYVPPPPPKVEVALPLKQTVTPYLNEPRATRPPSIRRRWLRG